MLNTTLAHWTSHFGITAFNIRYALPKKFIHGYELEPMYGVPAV